MFRNISLVFNFISVSLCAVTYNHSEFAGMDANNSIAEQGITGIKPVSPRLVPAGDWLSEFNIFHYTADIGY